MKSEIASLHERMGKSGDWQSFRNEIAALHDEATTEEEYITLLEAHQKLVAGIVLTRSDAARLGLEIEA